MIVPKILYFIFKMNIFLFSIKKNINYLFEENYNMIIDSRRQNDSTFNTLNVIIF